MLPPRNSHSDQTKALEPLIKNQTQQIDLYEAKVIELTANREITRFALGRQAGKGEPTASIECRSAKASERNARPGSL